MNNLTNSGLVRTSAIVASDIEGLRGYGTLEYEGQVPTKPYSCCFSREFSRLPFVLLHTCMPSLHTESTDSDTFTIGSWSRAIHVLAELNGLF